MANIISERILGRGTEALTAAAYETTAAHRILHLGFSFLPLIAGLDKFFSFLVEWPQYLSPVVYEIFGSDPAAIMAWAGAIEIAAAVLVYYRPRIGGYFVALWLWLGIVNFFSIPAYFDIALRDFALSLGALALAQLSRTPMPRP